MNRSDYTKVSGEVIDKYSRREGIGKSSTITDYLDVSFEYEGETYIASEIKANFWEKEGSTISFYISQDGKANRGTFTVGLWDFIFFLAISLAILYDIWKKRDTIFAGSTPVVPLTDQSSYNTSDTFVSSNTYISSDTYNSADTYSTPDVEISPSYQESTTNINSAGTQANTSYQSRSEAASTNNTEKEASFHDIPVIAIPNEYLQ